MIINDIVYGEQNVDEPVILELLKTPSLIRLKNISQFGVPDKYNHRKGYLRYEHCVGVMLLLRTLGASLEEQVSGLLHDTSALAFSHVADWIFGKGRSGDEGYHDTIHNEFIEQTEIPGILRKHEMSVDRILDESNFKLMERKIPELCADRVDYALRELAHGLDPEASIKILDAIATENDTIVFSNQDSAELFAKYFLDLQSEHWGSHLTVRRYHLFAKALNLAVERNYLAERDFWKDENFVLGKVIESSDGEILDMLAFLENEELSDQNYMDGITVNNKFRFVEPRVKTPDGLRRLSAISTFYSKALEKNRTFHSKGVLV